MRPRESSPLSAGSELLVRAEGLDLAYGSNVVLRGVDLEVRRGEFWFLLGGNGSGKTTFLRALLGMLPPRAGRIHLAAELEGGARVGFVPQSCELNRALPTTVREFVSVGLVGLRVPRADEPARLARALERVGLGGLAATDYWSLSGGQRQRALVARALIREPLLLVLDEPMNHLDPDAEEALLRDLLDLHRQQNLALILVTHDLEMAELHATHVATFGAGRVVVRARMRDARAERT